MIQRHSVSPTVIAAIVGLLIGSLLFLPFDTSPISGYRTMFGEAFFTSQGLGTTLTRATPLIFVALGTVVAWSAGFYYLGFQGALYMGATGATLVALAARDGYLLASLPSPVIVLLSLCAAFIFGGMWALMVAGLKVRFGGNEVLLSLMFNYVAVYLVNYLVTRPLRAPGSLPQTARFPDRATLPRLLGDRNDLHLGFVVAVLAALAVWWLMRSTTLGFELTTFGRNQRAAHYSGVSSTRVTLVAAFTAGGLGALAGWSQVLGVQYRLLDGLDQLTGFEGIVTALLGSLGAVGALVASVLYAGLATGAQVMQRRSDLPSSVALMIQGIVVLLALTGGSWRQGMHWLRHRRRRRQGLTPQTVEDSP
jgi:general nucleoside transport system permease protein